MKLIISVFVFFISSINMYSQCESLKIESDRRLKIYRTISDYDDKKDYLRQSIDHFISCGYHEVALDWQVQSVNISESQINIEDQYSAIQALDLLIAEYEDKLSTRFTFNIKVKSLNHWSDLNFNLGQHTKAIAYLQSIEPLIHNISDSTSDLSAILMSDTYKKLGSYYSSKKEYEKSISYLDKAMEACLIIKDYEYRVSREIVILGYYSSIYLTNNNPEQAKSICYEHLRKARELFQWDNYYKGWLLTANSRLADWHMSNNSIDSALYYNQEYGDLLRKSKASMFFNQIQKAKLYVKNGDYESAAELLISLVEKEGGIEKMIEKRAMRNILDIIDLLIRTSKFEIAISFQDSLFQHINENLRKNSNNELPIFNSNERSLLELLISKLSLPREFSNEDSVIQISKEAYTIVANGFQSITSKRDKQFFSSISSSLTNQVLKNLSSHNSDNREFAFSAIEQSKATTLSNSWKQKQQIKLSNNADIFFREEELLSELGRISKKILTEKDSSKMLAMKADIKLDEITLDSIKLELSKSHPAYYAMKYNWTHSTIKEIQNILVPDEVLVNYFEGDSLLYAIIISDQKSHIVQIDSLSYIRALIEEYTELLSAANLNYNNKQETDKTSYLIYKQLIAPLSDHLKDRIIISPSEHLNQIPFSSLRMNNDSNVETNGLLITHHAISYVPSASIFSQQRLIKNDNVINSALVIAPSFDSESKQRDFLTKRSSLGKLIFNVPEAEMVSNYTKNKLLINQHATKGAFLHALMEQDLIHFSTHAKSNEDAPDKSYIAFYGTGQVPDNDSTLLYLDDLSKLYMPAKMVVLSACETGLGKLYKGEGAMSLANACFYAGAQSVVSTLWSVQDETTFEIITLFYHYLDKGFSKDVALQKAQLDFLANNSETFHHPYYWAGYTTIGNTTPLVFRNGFSVSNWILFMSSTLVLALGFVLYRRKKRALAA